MHSSVSEIRSRVLLSAVVTAYSAIFYFKRRRKAGRKGGKERERERKRERERETETETERQRENAVSFNGRNCVS